MSKYLIEIDNIVEIDLIDEIVNCDFEDLIKRNGLLECKAL